MLLALAALWGASFVFIKVGVRELAPATLICFRLALGTLTLLPVALLTVGARELRRQIRAAAVPLALVGLLNSALPITLLAWAEKRLDSGLAAVIQASAPLFAALLALRFSRGEIVTASSACWSGSAASGCSSACSRAATSSRPWRSPSPHSATRSRLSTAPGRS